MKPSSLQFVNKIFNRSQFWNKYHRDALYKKYAHFVSFKSPNHNRNISSFLENIIIFISILLKGKKCPCVKCEDAHHFGFICKKYSNAGYKFRYITRKVKFITITVDIKLNFETFLRVRVLNLNAIIIEIKTTKVLFYFKVILKTTSCFTQHLAKVLTSK